MKSFASVLLVLVACTDDPSLVVTVTHPSGLAIASTTITDYESPTLTCVDVEFARMTTDQLAAVAIASETISASGAKIGALTGISRSDNKVIVAIGYDMTGQMLAGGCAQQGVVDGTVHLAIATVPAATPSISLPTSNDKPVDVAATGPDGSLLDNRPVSWTVYAGVGSRPTSSLGNVTLPPGSDGIWQATNPVCTNNGHVAVHPALPAKVGGYAVQIQVAWATQQPPMFTGLIAPQLAPTTFSAPTGAIHYCTPHATSSVQAVACVDSGNTIHDYMVAVSQGAAMLTDHTSGPLFANAPIAVVSMPAGTDRRDAYEVSQKGDVAALPGAAPPGPLAMLRIACSLVACDDAIGVPSCGAAQSAKIAVRRNQTLLVYDLVTGNVDAVGLNVPPAPENAVKLDNAGCVTVLGGAAGTTYRQIISVQYGHQGVDGFVPTASALVFAGGCAGGYCQLPMPLESGVGFTTGSEPRIVVTSLDATGVIAVEAVMVPSGTKPFVERASFAAASIPDHMVSGQYDGDSTSDLVWSLSGRRSLFTAFEAAYARHVVGQPLEALSQEFPISVDDIASFDLTPGVGFDDLVVTGSFASQQGVQIIPTGVDIVVPAMDDSPTCAP